MFLVVAAGSTQPAMRSLPWQCKNLPCLVRLSCIIMLVMRSLPWQCKNLACLVRLSCIIMLVNSVSYSHAVVSGLTSEGGTYSGQSLVMWYI